MGTMTDSDW